MSENTETTETAPRKITALKERFRKPESTDPEAKTKTNRLKYFAIGAAGLATGAALMVVGQRMGANVDEETTETADSSES